MLTVVFKAALHTYTTCQNKGIKMRVSGLSICFALLLLHVHFVQMSPNPLQMVSIGGKNCLNSFFVGAIYLLA